LQSFNNLPRQGLKIKPAEIAWMVAFDAFLVCLLLYMNSWRVGTFEFCFITGFPALAVYNVWKEATIVKTWPIVFADVVRSEQSSKSDPTARLLQFKLPAQMGQDKLRWATNLDMVRNSLPVFVNPKNHKAVRRFTRNRFYDLAPLKKSIYESLVTDQGNPHFPGQTS
jgi:hypothetical protein